MNTPYVSIVLCSILIIFEITVNLIYKSRELINKKFCYLENKDIRFNNFYKIYTSLITHNSILFHFIPNVLITGIMGTLLENIIGTLKMMRFVLACIFIFWTFIYLLGIKPKTGCGSSAIFYSFFSFYFTLRASTERNELTKVLYLLSPVIILIVLNILGRIKTASTEFVHALSLMYGYMAGIYYSQSRTTHNYFNLYK